MEVEDEYQPGGTIKPHTKTRSVPPTTWGNGHDNSKGWSGYKGDDWSTSRSTKTTTINVHTPVSISTTNTHSNATTKTQPIINRQSTKDQKHTTNTRIEERDDQPPCRDAPFQIEQFLSKPSSRPLKQQQQRQEEDENNECVLKHANENEDEEEEEEALCAIDPSKDDVKANSIVDALELWFPTELDDMEIRKRRAHIKGRMMSSECGSGGKFALSVRALRQLVCEYDRLFFDNRLFEALNHQKTALNVQIGGIRLKKGDAGCCAYAGDVCTIHLHPGLAELKIGADGCEDVNGIECKDVLDCVQLVFEHELIHMLIQVFLRLKESHGRNFKSLAAGLFGHPLFTHTIGSKTKESAAQRVRRAQDAEAKRKLYTPGTVIRIGSENANANNNNNDDDDDDNEAGQVGAVIVRKQETVTVMFADGRLLEKVPYLLTDMWVVPDDFKGHDDLQILEKHYMLFLDNKKNLTVGQQVEYADAHGQIKLGQVLKKKPLGVLVQISPSSTSILPFHTVRTPTVSHKK